MLLASFHYPVIPTLVCLAVQIGIIALGIPLYISGRIGPAMFYGVWGVGATAAAITVFFLIT